MGHHAVRPRPGPHPRHAGPTRWTLDDGSTWLVGELGRRAGVPPDDLRDGLAELAGTGHDDVAVLAVRVPG
ncbi:hypothetical protein JOD57_002622 [Geodermatophilus bullaregiensis]|uniref:hypothetical protein n=1 Tax=Geodermatophilus bullaregiensis TaxID=1564160 RepID=UPI001956BEF9|nr:hypothetical protein [Geodermatophilus bullaregiensis]MBM7806785.1 hypothetical protein [Geodermatophilus bullaregiensis]